MYACDGILFNHESSLRGETFVTRKITRALARIHLGLQDCLYLGNLDALRDWGHARDYVEMQRLMLQEEQAEDFVIATGQQVSMRTFVDTAAAELGVRIDWHGAAEQETWTVAEAPAESAMRPGQIIVRVDPRYYRPTEVEPLLGDPTKARERLGWTQFLGYWCIYPKHAPQRIQEAALLTGPLEPTNRPYALAKIAGIELCWSYNRQHHTQYLAAMPTNL